MTSSTQQIQLQENDNEALSVFLLEDLIKEYNYKGISTPSMMNQCFVPLSMKPIVETKSHFSHNPDYPTIAPLTEEELSSYNSLDLKGNDKSYLLKAIRTQVSPKGLVRNIPRVTKAITLATVVKELGLTGKIYFKTDGNKTYVILKGTPANRTTLTGTRYLSTHPKVTKFGFTKVNIRSSFAKGFKTSIFFYGIAKVVEATQMLIEHGELKTSFFAEVLTAIPKIVITSTVAAAVSVGLASAAIPVAVSLGVVLVVGIGVSIGLQYLDYMYGITEKVTEVVGNMYNDLLTYMSETSQKILKYCDWDKTIGLVFEKTHQEKNYLVNTEKLEESFQKK